MIIECIKCHKRFNVDSNLIPSSGRSIQCGSCQHIWFYRKNDNQESFILNDVFDNKKPDKKKEVIDIDSPVKKNKKDISKIKKKSKNKELEKNALVKYQGKKKSFFGIIFSYLLVLIISFVALILILDTFKNPLINIFPSLELWLFNLFETFKDVKLFLEDLK